MNELSFMRNEWVIGVGASIRESAKTFNSRRLFNVDGNEMFIKLRYDLNRK